MVCHAARKQESKDQCHEYEELPGNKKGTAEM